MIVHRFLLGSRSKGQALAMAGVLAMGMLGGCATPTDTVVMQQPSGPPQQVAVPKSMWTGAASGARERQRGRYILTVVPSPGSL